VIAVAPHVTCLKAAAGTVANLHNTMSKADSSGRGNTSYVSVEFISAAIFSAGV